MNVQLSIAAIFVLVATTACSTPRAVRESATFGVSTAASREEALKAFREEEKQAVASREESLIGQHDASDRANSALKFTARMRIASGDSASISRAQLLLESADAVALSTSELATAKALDAKTISALTTPLPSTEAASDDTQKAFAELAADLPGGVQFQETKAFGTAVVGVIKENRKKIEKAKKLAAEEAAKK